jgi:hypothetical protein
MFQPVKKVGVGVAALAAFALGGAALANATATATSPSTSSQSRSSGQPPANHGPAPGTAAHESAEKPVTGTAADKARAAAVKYVGSGTAGAVTSDLSGTGYETTVAKSDGSKVEVHLDSSFTIVQCHGGPPPAGSSGHPAGPPPVGSGYAG